MWEYLKIKDRPLTFAPKFFYLLEDIENTTILFTRALNYLPDSPGSSRKHGGLVQAHAANIHHMETVYILGRRDCIADHTLIDVVCEKEEENLIYVGEQHSLGSVCR